MSWLGVLLLVAVGCDGQSNYASRTNSIEFPNEGLPDSTLLDGKVTKLDELSSVIFLNRTKANLNCASGYMQIELTFDQPFFGIVYANFERTNPCQIAGHGEMTAKIDLPLKGCGTRQDPTRVFTNNIVVRFHPALEIEGDEVVTIVCRYPPPVAPPPAGLPNYIKEEPIAASPLAPPLRGFQILMIICGILFLSLVLLGLGCSYYMLRKRRIQVVRRAPVSIGSGSEITKLSGSSLGNISMFEGLKIPRAQPPSTSGSEAALISDTLPSDYPSESPSSAHSELEDIESRSLRRSVSSAGSYDNRAYIHDSYFSEEIAQKTETEIRSIAHKRPPPDPKFDVKVRVKKAAAPPPPSPTPPPSESDVSIRNAERNLTTILEEEMPHKTTFTYVPEIHSPPKMPTPPPVYSTVVRKQQASKNIHTTEESYMSHDMVDEVRRRPSLSSDYTEARSMSEIMEHTSRKVSPPPAPIIQSYRDQEMSTTVELIEPPVVASRRPEIKSHVVDDVFRKTITEKKTFEDIERRRRIVPEYRKPAMKWDVQIKSHPKPPSTPSVSSTDWDTYSERSSVSGRMDAYRSDYNQSDYTQHSEVEIERLYKSTVETMREEEKPKQWDVLVRVLEPPPYETDVSDDARSDVTSVKSLSLDDRKRWKDIITTESTLRTMLAEATAREDYERIRKDERYEKLFEPYKWDVIIRVLAPPSGQYEQRGGSGSNKYRRKADWETRSRRSSLPTLYEFDSDGESSVRTITGGQDTRRTSRSSMVDLRSMSEMTVEYAREYNPRYMDWEERSLARSNSQPSLARSGSEFTEQWARPRHSWDSPEHSPISSRRQTTTRRLHYETASHGWFETDK